MDRCRRSGRLALLALGLALVAQVPAHAWLWDGRGLERDRDRASERYLRVDFENDWFGQRDHYYTQGCGLVFSAAELRFSPLFHLVPALPFATDIAYQIHFQYEAFTPRDIHRALVQDGDRPFAAVFYLGHRRVASSPALGLTVTTELDIGALGPIAGGGALQRLLHRVVDDEEPRGWSNQVENDIVVDVQARLDKRLLWLPPVLELSAGAYARLGTLRTRAGADATLRLGLLDDRARSWIPLPWPSARSIFVFARPQVWVVGYDATFQGGLLNRSSVHRCRVDRLKRVVYGVDFGIAGSFDGFSLEYSLGWIAPEFDGGGPHLWGGLSASFGF